MSKEQEEKLKDYATQHINNLEIINQKTIRINELKEELEYYKKETEKLKEYNQLLENESNENDKINLTLHNQIEELKDIVKKLASYL